jgi:NAD(P)-dependent dehydrogenase (short-subunit alcohol dehydrogenase family)
MRALIWVNRRAGQNKCLPMRALCSSNLHKALRLEASVVHMASVQGFASQAGVVAYSTAKHGMIGLVHAMAVDAAPYGVRVNGVAPGSVDTPMLRESIALAKSPDEAWATIKALHPLRRAANAEEIAEVVAFLASSAASQARSCGSTAA